MTAIGSLSLAQHMLWEREQGLKTDPAKFRDFLEWRKRVLAQYDEWLKARQAWEQRGLLRKIFAREAKPRESQQLCDCIASMRRVSSLMSWLSGVRYSVCEEHAMRFGIHSGSYYEDELLTIMDRIREVAPFSF